MSDEGITGREAIDDVVAELRRRVEERKRSGDYPPGLVEDLEAHFARIAPHRFPAYDIDLLKAKIGALDAAGAFNPAAISYDTRVPGGSFVHRLLGKVVRRQTEGVLAQAQRHADAVKEALWEVVAALETPAAHSHVDLVGEIDALFEKLAVLERSRTTSADGLAQRVQALEERAVRAFEPWYSSTEFENRFRGGGDELRARYKDLASMFADVQGPVIDIGCGRGEFLELLLANDVEAQGIEVDTELVRDCVARELPVTYGEAVAWLSTSPEQGIGGIAMIQVIEHLAPQAVVDFISVAARKVRPGGIVVVETVNPQSLYTFAHAFYLDPTHQAPVHPAYLMFLFEQAGFSKVDVQWRSPTPPDDQLQPIESDALDEATRAQINANNDRVNKLVFADQDYAIIAVR